MSRQIKGLPLDKVQEVFKKLKFRTEGLYIDNWTGVGKPIVNISLIPETVSPYRRVGATGRRTTAACVHGYRAIFQALVAAGATDNIANTRGSWRHEPDIKLIEPVGTDAQRAEVNKILGAKCGCKVEIPDTALTITPPVLEEIDEESMRSVVPFQSHITVAYRTYKIEFGKGLIGQFRGVWDKRTFAAMCDRNNEPRVVTPTTNKTPTPMEMLMGRRAGDTDESNDGEKLRKIAWSKDDTPEIVCEKHLAADSCPRGDPGCGLYSFREPPNAGVVSGQVLAQMVLGGVIYPYSEGFRSSQARIEALWVVKEAGEDTITNMDTGFARLLSQQYENIPVETVAYDDYHELQKKLMPENLGILQPAPLTEPEAPPLPAMSALEDYMEALGTVDPEDLGAAEGREAAGSN